MAFIIGGPLLFIALSPFPLGCGLIFPIRDVLRGHPQGPHGTQPQTLAGLWVRDEYVEFDFLGQAFYLMPNGRFAGMGGMTTRRWHFDNNCLFIDSVSGCGNCYQGNVTAEHSIRFVGTDQLLVNGKDNDGKKGVVGMYRRVEINDAFKAEMNRRQDSKDEAESFNARMVLRVIDQFEALSKDRP